MFPESGDARILLKDLTRGITTDERVQKVLLSIPWTILKRSHQTLGEFSTRCGGQFAAVERGTGLC